MSQALNCPECGSGLKTVDSRPHYSGVYRRRRCILCNVTYGTIEVILPEGNSVEDRFNMYVTNRSSKIVNGVINKAIYELKCLQRRENER